MADRERMVGKNGGARFGGSSSAPRSVSPDDSAVVAALQDYLRLLEKKEAPSRSAFLAKHPRLAEPLAAALDGLNLMHHVASGIKNLPPAPKPVGPDLAQPALPLGDFKIIREIGRGGMGVVYEAEQLSLGRRVALKVLPFAAALDAKQLARFKNEASAAAHLHHTNIVPVFAVGADRGVHYYAMQYIEGQTLADFIRERRHLEKQLGERGGKAADPSSVSSAPAAPQAISPAAPRSVGRSSLIDVQADDSVTAPYGSPPKPSSAPPPAAEPSHANSTRAAANHSTKIAGSGLDYWKSLARLGLQAAEALDYAHSMGVVHRDMKPANMLVDHRGNLWVTDFGLAQFRRSGELTLSGDLLGTARYMSPEQTRGERGRVDHHTDIYSLGVTLYELFTLRHAFDGQGWNDLMRQIAHEEPRPLRQARPALPAELEIIVQKAMAKNPADRYATAADLAEDLRRFVDDRPILAKRPTLLQLANKFARRHRAAIGLAFAALVAAFCVLSWFYWQLFVQSTRTDLALKKAQSRTNLARSAVDEMYTNLAEKWLKNHPQLQEVQLDFLRKARDFYAQFAKESGDAPEVRRQQALALRRVGEIERMVRNYPRAYEAYAEALSLFRRLAADAPANFLSQFDLARTRGGMGVLQLDLRELTAAVDSFEEALELDRRLAPIAGPSDRDAVRLELAAQMGNLGVAQQRLRQFAPARANLKAGLELLEELRRDAKERFSDGEPSERKLERLTESRLNLEPELARLHLSFSLLCHECGKKAEAGLHARQSLDLTRRLSENFPYESKFKSILAESLKQIGQRCYDAGQHREAAEHLREALSHYEQLSAHLGLAANRREEAGCLSLLARTAKERGRLNEAAELYGREIAIREKLAHSADADRKALGVSMNNLGHVLLENQKAAAAEAVFRQAEGLEDFDRFAAPPAQRHRVAVYQNNLARALWQLDRLEEAEKNYKNAVEQSEMAVAEAPSRPEYRPVEYRDAAARLHRNYGLFLIHIGRLQEAERELKEAMAQELKLRIEREHEPKWHIQCAQSHLRLAALCERQRQPGQAERHYQAAEGMLRELVGQLPDNAEALNRLAWFLASCPNADRRDYRRAQELAEQALKCEMAPDAAPAEAKRTLGLLCLRRGDPANAVALLEEARRESEKRDPVTLLLLALAYARHGDSLRAFERYMQAGVEQRQRAGAEDEEYQFYQAEFRATFKPAGGPSRSVGL